MKIAKVQGIMLVLICLISVSCSSEKSTRKNKLTKEINMINGNQILHEVNGKSREEWVNAFREQYVHHIIRDIVYNMAEGDSKYLPSKGNVAYFDGGSVSVSYSETGKIEVGYQVFPLGPHRFFDFTSNSWRSDE